jgi:transcriptional regulator with XRE-family HTH domain
LEKTFGQTLYELRHERKMTLQVLSILSGLSIMTLSNLENDKYKPRALTVMKLIGPLQCDVVMGKTNIYLKRKENKYGN